VKRIFSNLLFAAAFSFQYHNTQAQTYFVKKIPDGGIQVNGKGDAPAWQKANPLTHFIYPWESIPAPATSFAALYNDQWLYLLYRVTDDSVIVPQGPHNKMAVGAADRVEIFFKENDKMSPYYCLEMDASATVLDYTADYYRQMHYEWQWPKEALLIASSRTKEGYTLEAAISINALKKFGLLKNKEMQAGLFRAERTGTENGKAVLKWISWIDPKSATPDFHIPAAFGLLKLE